jgi:uncharacterized protein YlzI (FlbEa/FlbD family)
MFISIKYQKLKAGGIKGEKAVDAWPIEKIKTKPSSSPTQLQGKNYIVRNSN